MRPGLAKLIEEVLISRNFESPRTDLHIAANPGCIGYAYPGSSKRVHFLSKSQTKNHVTAYYGCDNSVGFDTGVA